MAKHYLTLLGLIILFSFLVAGTFNWFINPFSIYSSPYFAEINKDKVEFLNYLRLTKAYQEARQKPAAVILGTSRAGRGLDPNHPGWQEQKVYNLAFPSATMYEMLRYFQHANAVQPLHQVVITLDYRCFTTSDTFEGFSDARLRVSADGTPNEGYILGLFSDAASTLFSIDAIVASLDTIRRQGWSMERLYENGRWDRITEQYHYRKAFNAYLKSTINRIGKKLTFNNYSPDKFDAFRVFLQTAYENDIKVYLAISPSHALHWEIYRILGLWDKFEELKRNLVIINEQEARRAGKPAYPIWDFSGYNSLSTEQVPQSNEPELHMQWFWDPVHYKKRLGDFVLDRLFEFSTGGQTIPEDFGIKLTPENIESHFKQQRQAQQDYCETHREEIRKIEKLAENFL